MTPRDHSERTPAIAAALGLAVAAGLAWPAPAGAQEAAVQVRPRPEVRAVTPEGEASAQERILRPIPEPPPEPPAGEAAEPPAFPEVVWHDEPIEFVHRLYFATDPWSGPQPSAVALVDPERPGVYYWEGMPLWLVVEVEDAPEGRALCAEWPDPAGEVAARRCQLLPAGPARLAFAAPDTLGWAGDGRAVRLFVQDAGEIAPLDRDLLAEAVYNLGVRRMASMDPPGEIPAFQWPPPPPSTRATLPADLLGAGGARPETLGAVADRLLTGLEAAGYQHHGFPFYSLPGGFALATQIEQIEFDGTPRQGEARFSAGLPPRRIESLGDFLSALFTAPEGHYRVIVFAVTDRVVTPGGEPATRDDAMAWMTAGGSDLPRSIRERPFGPDHRCTALVYQFRRVGAHGEAVVLGPADGISPAEAQLAASDILPELWD